MSKVVNIKRGTPEIWAAEAPPLFTWEAWPNAFLPTRGCSKLKDVAINRGNHKIGERWDSIPLRLRHG